MKTEFNEPKRKMVAWRADIHKEDVKKITKKFNDDFWNRKLPEMQDVIFGSGNRI